MGGGRIQPHSPDAIADGGAPEQEVDQDRQNDGVDDARMQQRAGDQPRQPDLHGQSRALGNVGAGGNLFRIEHGTAQEEVHQLQRDHVQHDRRKNLIDLEPGLEHAGNAAPDRACQRTHKERQGQEHPARPGGKGQGESRCRQGADDDLAFTADVDHAAPEGNANAQSDQQQRRHFGERLGDPRHIAKRAPEHGPIGFNRIFAQQEEQNGADQHRGGNGKDRQCNVDRPVHEGTSPPVCGGSLSRHGQHMRLLR